MAQIYKSYAEHLNSILNPPPRADAAAEQPGTVYGSPAGAGGSPGATTASVFSPQAPQGASALAEPTQRVHTAPGGQGPYTADPQLKGVFERLFAPIDKGQAAQQTALGDITGAFSEAAGPRRNYEGIGGEGILEKAIRGSETEIPDFTNQAKGLLGAHYTGPTSLDQDTTEAISRALGNFQTQLGSPAGIRDLIRQQTPGLTPGMVRFEGGRLSQDPGFRERKDAERLELGRLFGKLGISSQQAEDYAAGRAAEETDIANKAKGYLTGERGEISSDLEQKIAASGADQAKAQALYDKFMASGNLAQLTQLGQATGQPGIGEQFVTPAAKEANLATGEFEVLKRKYADIADVPLMQLAATSHGRQTLRFPDEWFAANASRYTPAQMATVKEKARQRQLELEKFYGTQTALQKYFPVEYGGADTMQQLEAQKLAGTDARPYVALEPGMQANRGNVSTPEQRDVFNRINGLLEEADRIIETSPQRAAQVEADLDGYIAEQEASIKHRKEQVTQNELAWLDYLHDARKRFRDKRNKHNITNLFDAVSMGAYRGTLTPILGAAKGPEPLREEPALTL